MLNTGASSSINCMRGIPINVQSRSPQTLFPPPRPGWAQHLRCWAFLSPLAVPLTVFRPLVLTANLLLLLTRKVVRDVKGLTDLLWRLALDHVRHSLAPDVEEGLDIEVVGGL